MTKTQMNYEKVYELLRKIPNPDFDYVDLMDDIHCIDRNILVRSGATRIGILIPGYPNVIKIAYLSNDEQDYNELEYKNYQRAVELKISKILLPLFPMEVLPCGVRVFEQPKVDTTKASFGGCDTDKIRNHLRQIVKRQSSQNKQKGLSRTIQRVTFSAYDGTWISQDWITLMILLYGKKFARAFAQWTHECYVNDLHNGNIGVVHGKPLIWDYAGYHGN